jgi:protein O-mannosyl-transferase
MGQPSKGQRERQPPPQQPRTHERLAVLVVCCFLLLTVLAVYNPTTGHEFLICDDDVYVYVNRHVSEGLTWGNVKWSLTRSAAGNWHPLTWLSHILDVSCYGIHPGMELWKGPEAGGHHFTNVFLHAAAAVVLFLTLRRMTAALWCSAFVAAMFALHPLRVESVAWVAERKDVLSGLFWMLTLLAYAAYASRPGVARYLAVVVCFALGLMSKSMVVTLPCVLLLLDFWPLRRWQPKGDGSNLRVNEKGTVPLGAQSPCPPRSLQWLVAEKAPLLALSAAVCAIVAMAQHDVGTVSTVSRLPLEVRLANAAVSAVAYLWTMIWPVNLAIFYPHPLALANYSPDRLIWQGVAAGVLLLAITLAVLWNLRRRPYLAVGWFWYLGSLVPVIGIVQVGTQSRADRYTYLPMIGISIMLAWGTAELVARSGRVKTVVGVAAGALLLAWTLLTVRQVAVWQDSFTVFKHAIEATENNYFAHNHLGMAYLRDGNEEEAASEFAKAVEIAPGYDAANANLGAYYAGRKQYDKALPYLQAAVRVNPSKVGCRANLGTVYTYLGRLDEATAEFRRALEIDPDDAQARLNLSRALCRAGNTAEMLAEWRAVIRIVPNSIEVRCSAARLLATHPDASLRNGEEAVTLAQRAVELSNAEDPLALDALAAAQAEIGQFKVAEKTATDAATLALRQQKPDLAESIKGRISLYKDGKPWREPPPTFDQCPLSP